MTRYRCTVISAEGRSDWRMLEAPDEESAVAKLVAEGLTPLEVREGSPSLVERLNRPVSFGRRLRLDERSLILTQLAMLVRSGLPVDRSLDLLREQAPRAAQREQLAQVVARVRGGGSLASGLDALGSFPAYAVGVIRAAERGGRLGDALTSLAARLEEAARTRRQLITALTYPAAVLVATMLALALVLTLVVPQFEPIFAGEETRLPGTTRMVLWLSHTVDAYGWWLLLASVACPLLLWQFLRSDAGVAFVGQHRRRIPGMGLRDQYLAGQFTGTLGTLLVNGVSAVAALPLTRAAMGSRRWRDGLDEVERRVREGERLSAALGRIDLVPSTAVRLIEVGERSGGLGQTCLQASRILSDTARARIERIVSLVNPVAIVSLGGLVALLVAGVMLGIFALGDFAG